MADTSRLISSFSAAVVQRSAEVLRDMLVSSVVTDKALLDVELPMDWTTDPPLFSASVPAIRRMPTFSVIEGYYTGKLDDLPHRLHAGFLHMFQGTTVAFVVPPSYHIEQHDFVENLSAAPSVAMKRVPHFILLPGMSLWIPYGSLLIITAVPSACADLSSYVDGRPSKAALEESEGKARSTRPNAIPTDFHRMLGHHWSCAKT